MKKYKSNIILHAEYAGREARRKPRVVEIFYRKAGVLYRHVSPFLGTTNVTSYMPGQNLKFETAVIKP